MLVARWGSTCTRCHLAIVPGDAISTGGLGAAHMVCPELEPGGNGEGSHAEPYGSNGSRKTDRLLTAEEKTAMFADMRLALELGGQRRDRDRHLRAGKGTAELLANADERLALYEPVDYYGVVHGDER